MIKFISTIVIVICFYPYLFAENEGYSREMQQAIRLYEEGKNSDAMDRFMEILVNGTPEEKSLANEYISKITQGISPVSKKSSTKVEVIDSKKDLQNKVEIDSSKIDLKKDQPSASQTGSEEDLLAEKVEKKIIEIRRQILNSLYQKNYIKFYMSQSQDKPLYILLKDEKIFNENMTFNEKVIDDLKMLGGLFLTLERVVITILPNGAVNGNMKISSVRKSSVLHSFFTSYGISPSKIKLDMVGDNIQISKKIDDTDGILLILNYEKEADNLLQDLSSPGVYVAIYPSRINTLRDDAAIIEFSVVEGKNPIAGWNLVVKRKGSASETQKLEGTQPTLSHILFNGREKFTGSLYPPGEYEFYLEASDIKGNNSAIKKSLYLNTTRIQENDGDNKKSNVDIKHRAVEKKSGEKEDKAAREMINKTNSVYKIYFTPDTFEITENSKKKIEEIVSDYVKMNKPYILLTAYAYSKEKKPKSMAKKRASAVKNYIIDTYKVNPKKIIEGYRIVNIKKVIVEVSFKKNVKKNR